MSEERVPSGDEAQKWERDAQELRSLLDKAGYTQVAAAQELDYSERAIRGFCSGREPVPRAVMYALQWIAEKRPNRDRFLQVHWRRANLTVKAGDKFDMTIDGPQLIFWRNNEVAIRGKLSDLAAAGVISIHSSASTDRFRIRMPASAAESQVAQLDVTFGERVGYRLVETGADGYKLSPSVQFFTADGRLPLSALLCTPEEIEHAAHGLKLNVDAMARSASAALMERVQSEPTFHAGS